MQEFEALTRSDISTDRDPLVIEIVYDAPLPLPDIQQRVDTALPGATFNAEAVFDPGEDRFFFVEFPEIDPKGQEGQVFSFARALRAALDAAEANPVLPDSLYGAIHVGTESLSGFCQTTSDSTLPFGWHHPRIKTPLAWRKTRGRGSKVAVIDTGYSDHNELSGTIETNGMWNFVEGNGDARDRFSGGFLTNPGHGTLVASVVGSRGGADMNGSTTSPGAVTGTAPQAKVLPIRAIKSVVDMTQRRIPAAISHAVNQNADVIVMALGGPSRVSATEQALRNAAHAGLVIVCAAGNCYPNVIFPAAYADMGICTAVAALQPDKRPWRNTGRGPEVSFSAYGENVWGAAKNKESDPNNGVRASQGTTLATSISGGIAALWVAHHGGRAALRQKAQTAGTTVQAMWLHCATHGMSRPPEWAGATNLGAGIIDAQAVLNAPLPTGAESPAAPDPNASPTLNILVSHLAGTDSAAAGEVTPDMTDYAGEIIWLSYRRGARRRISEHEDGIEAAVGEDTATSDLEAALSGKPALSAHLGMG